MDPRPDDRIIQTTGILPRPICHSRANSQARNHDHREESDSGLSLSFLARLGRTARPDQADHDLSNHFDDFMMIDASNYSKGRILKLSEDFGRAISSSVHGSSTINHANIHTSLGEVISKRTTSLCFTGASHPATFESLCHPSIHQFSILSDLSSYQPYRKSDPYFGSITTRAKITRTVHRKGQRAESKDQRADMCTYGQPRTSYVLCVLTDTHGRPVCTEQTAHVGLNHPNSPREGHGHPVCADGHTRTHKDSHGCPVCAGGHPRTSFHGKGQRAESKDQRADMCTDGQHERPVCADGHTRTATDVLCMLTDTHGGAVCADGHPRTSCPQTATDVLCVLADTHGVLCVLNRQPTWDKITQTVHGKGQRAESKDQRSDMCTEGQPLTSRVC
ncbi:hypothetical protein IGI04_036046 [Brassica rapa subsp. trilocularis]|uniref:Uncharacterized protein n=1 Tax=Brassica rapa subsp. trilocularis TaxID=1813537 RepID=A0ABQ7LH64_BRACM|nr:hypothetical protein IGI04_036046 [Brassica rapa subsp. trilocularis]